MADDLSAATAAQGSCQIAALCRHLEFFAGHPAVAISPLSHGDLNVSYRVETCRGIYVVRQYPQHTSGVCRQQELRCQHAAAVAGIAPAPLCLNNHQQVLISEFVTDNTPFLCDAANLTLLADTLATFHCLSTQTAVLQPHSYLKLLAQYAAAKMTSLDAAQLSLVYEVARQFQQLSPDIVLCHLDLHAANMVLASEKLWLLDFEYAQRADSCLDLAGLSLYLQLDIVAEHKLLASYCQYRGNIATSQAELNAKMRLAKILYCSFCWLWYLSLPDRHGRHQAQVVHWQQRLAGLLKLQATKPLS
tara:strand:+ start:3118 stop:4029 length:912 start_codon:yes stop_codon:yes gene_type:complete